MLEVYLGIWLIGLILLIIFGILGGFGADAEAASADVDVDMADVDADVDLGDVDVDSDLDLDIDADADIGSHPSPLSLPLIFVWLTSFGALGMLFETWNFNWYLVPTLSGGISIFIAAIVFFILVKIFSATQASTSVPLHRLVGKKATVSIPIRKGGEGQVVVVTKERGRIQLGAIGDTYFATHSIVVIEDIVGSKAKVRELTSGKRRQAVVK